MTQIATDRPYYAVFVGPIDQNSARAICNHIGVVLATGFDHLHLLWQSNGGGVAEGVFLYEFFRRLPMKLTIYNSGTVASAATIAFLGAKNRIAGANATFMLHRPQAPTQIASPSRLERMAQSLLLDDERMEAILKANCNFSTEQWAIHRYDDLWLSADDAVSVNVATAKGDFSPPFGIAPHFF